MLRLCALRLLLACVDEELDCRERQARIDEPSPDVARAVAPLLERRLFVVIVFSLGKSLNETPKRIRGEPSCEDD